MDAFQLTPGHLSLEACALLAKPGQQIQLADGQYEKVERAQQFVIDRIASGETIYGVNTGFGILSNTVIEKEKLQLLQKNLVLSHAAGVGDDLPADVVRLMLALKINSLACGYSGISRVVLDQLIALYNADLLPVVPAKGSVGASGDLAPLAHCALLLIGEGDADWNGQRISAPAALAEAGLSPVDLGPKEGLALLNGTQASTAIALAALLRARQLFQSALVTGALTSYAIGCNMAAFDEKIHIVRNQAGQIQIASALRDLLKGFNPEKTRVQDPYSIRCQPQVVGACYDALTHVTDIILRECNAVSDNPLVFAEQEQLLSGGNFHAEPIALASDYLALALSEIGALSERRTALLVDANMSGLPPFLVEESGLRSGFMIAHVTAAALASENKTLASPCSIDSLPTSANQEDHVSMATNAARRLNDLIDNLEYIYAVECYGACQAILLQQKQDIPQTLQKIVNQFTKEVGLYADNRVISKDIQQVRRWLQEGLLAAACPTI